MRKKTEIKVHMCASPEEAFKATDCEITELQSATCTVDLHQD